MRSLMAVVAEGESTNTTLPLRTLEPTDGTTLSFLQAQELRRAFESAGKLSQYTEAQLASADAWVINLYPGKSISSVATAVGASVFEASKQIVDTFIVNVPASGYATFARSLLGQDAVQYAYPLVPEELVEQFVPNDPLYPEQWHLKNTGQSGGTANADANVEQAWDQVTGAGVVIGIVDDSFQHSHPDLAAKYQANLSYDFRDNDNDPAPDLTDDFHGTSVGGVAAAATNNNVGVSGAAPAALLAGIRLIGGPTTDLMKANALTFQSQQIDIYNNSWGPASNFLAIVGPLTLAALQQATESGRANKGNVYTFAGGNNDGTDDNVNYDGIASSRYVLAVGALDVDGAKSDYSENGASLLISAPSSSTGLAGITTTDLVGNNGYNAAGNGDGDTQADVNYTSTFGGTSSATPLVSGVIALVLEANPNLSWRDVKLILARSAKKNVPNDPGWVTNGIYHVSDDFGFGAIDALAAVNLAKTWTNVGAEVATSSGLVVVNKAIPDNNNTGVSATTSIGQDVTVETVEVVFTATHFFPGDLEVTLTSPAGIKSRLSEKTTLFGDYDNWVFSTTHDLGETSKGIWTVTVKDLDAGVTGTFDSFQINVYGSAGATFTPLGQVTGQVFYDANKNGVKDTGEGGQGGWTVYADVNDNGSYDPLVDRGAVSSGSGSYTITDVAPGSVRIREVIKTDWEQTAPTGGFGLVTVVGNQTITGPTFGNFREVLTITSTSTDGNALRDFILGPGVTSIGNATFVGSDVSAGFFTGGLGSIGMAQGIVLTSGDAAYTEGPNAEDASTGTASGDGDPALDAEYNFVTRDTTALEFTFNLDEDGDLSFNFVFASEEYNDYANSTFNDVFAFFIDGQNIALIPGTTEKISINTINGGNPLGTSPKHPELFHNNDLDDDGDFLDVFGHNGFTSVFKAEKLNLSAGTHTIRLSISDVGDESLDSAVFIESGSFASIPDPGEIGGTVFFDSNGNGSQNTGELGIPGVIVYLDLNNDGQMGFGEPAQYTDANGNYRFPLLPPNTYRVRQANNSGFQQTFPPNNNPQVIELELEEIITNANFGNANAFDYGDAPATFPTLKPNGAFHTYHPAYYLGNGVSPDIDGHPGTNATNDGDDDGVEFTSTPVAGQAATVDVTASKGGYLNAWVDFNNDGFWEPSEQIFTDKAVGAGVSHLSYAVPSSLTAGALYARFRYSANKGVGISGSAQGGEVEDYSITAALGIPAAPSFTSFTAFTNTTNRYDVNNDGHVTNLDALILVAQLRAGGPQLYSRAKAASELFIDINGDSKLTNLDVSFVIYQLRYGSRSGGEGEGFWFEDSTPLAKSLVAAPLSSDILANSAATAAPRKATVAAALPSPEDAVELPVAGVIAPRKSLVDPLDFDVSETDLDDELVEDVATAWNELETVGLEF